VQQAVNLVSKIHHRVRGSNFCLSSKEKSKRTKNAKIMQSRKTVMLIPAWGKEKNYKRTNGKQSTKQKILN